MLQSTAGKASGRKVTKGWACWMRRRRGQRVRSEASAAYQERSWPPIEDQNQSQPINLSDTLQRKWMVERLLWRPKVNSAACKTLTCVATNLAACATAELQTMSAETLSLALKSFVPLILGSVGPMAITSLPHQVSFKEGLRSTSARLPLCDY